MCWWRSAIETENRNWVPSERDREAEGEGRHQQWGDFGGLCQTVTEGCERLDSKLFRFYMRRGGLVGLPQLLPLTFRFGFGFMPAQYTEWLKFYKLGCLLPT